MSDRAYHWLIFGTTGSGKTSQGRAILRRYVRKPRYHVIVNSSAQLSEFARQHVVVGVQELEHDWTKEQLMRIIRAAGAVHFEVATGADPKRIKAFMDALGHAVMGLGVLDTDLCIVLLTMDECQNWLNALTWSRGMAIVYSEGRKYGIHTVAMTPQISGQAGEAIFITPRKLMTLLVVCPIDEPNERAKVLSAFPQLPDPVILGFPDKDTGRPGEYMVRDRVERRAALVQTEPNGLGWRRVARPLVLGGSGPPKGVKA